MVGPLLLVAIGIAYLTARAAPRISDGSGDLRRVHLVMSDEAVILENSWAMVGRGDLDHRIRVYPGLYPYATAIVRVLGKGASVETLVERTRWLSLTVTWLALLIPFGLLALLAEDGWVPAVFTALLAVHPETIRWASRVHPDAFTMLFNHASLACFGLAVARSRRWLWAATALAALSAGTKLFGCFIMAAIGLYIVWDRRRDPRALARELALHSLLFGIVFLLTTPMLVLDPKAVLDGFTLQHKRNRRPRGATAGWWATFTSARGLGFAGVAAIVVGLSLDAWHRFRGHATKGTGAILLFAAGYFVFILAGVRLTLPRYAAPGTWPMLFVALLALRPRLFPSRAAAWTVVLALAVGFAVFDWPRQRKELAMEDAKMGGLFGPEITELADHLRGVAERHPGKRVLSSPYIWVPEPVPWHVEWSLDVVQLPGDYAAVVVEPFFANDEAAAKLERGALPFTATATIGRFVVYERSGAP